VRFPKRSGACRPGQIAIHGLEHVGGVLGTAVSHGCIRMANGAMRWLVLRSGPGIPVSIDPDTRSSPLLQVLKLDNARTRVHTEAQMTRQGTSVAAAQISALPTLALVLLTVILILPL